MFFFVFPIFVYSLLYTLFFYIFYMLETLLTKS